MRILGNPIYPSRGRDRDGALGEELGGRHLAGDGEAALLPGPDLRPRASIRR